MNQKNIRLYATAVSMFTDLTGKYSDSRDVGSIISLMAALLIINTPIEFREEYRRALIDSLRDAG